MAFSANSPLMIDSLTRLMAGQVPPEWQSTDLVVNEADCPEWALPIFEKAKDMIQRTPGAPSRKASKDCYVFANKQHSPLGQSLKDNGWVQFSAQVQHFKSKEEAMDLGEPYRQYRYSVHAWKHRVTNHIMLAKLKLEGKYIPTPTLTPGGRLVFHADHDLGAEHFAVIDSWLGIDWDGQFKIGVIDLPDDCPDLLSALYGPMAGDDPIPESEVTYEKRGGRPGPSRMIDKPMRWCRKMVVVAGPAAGGKGAVYTAYGTQASVPSPREWWDSSMMPHEALEACRTWMDHALAKG